MLNSDNPEYTEVGGILFDADVIQSVMDCADEHGIPIALTDFRVMDGMLLIDNVTPDEWVKTICERD